LHVGHADPTVLAGDALLSPERLTSPHGHGGQVVVGATVVVGCGVNCTGGDVVVDVQSCSQFSPSYPWLHTQTLLTQPPFPLHTAVNVPLAGEALLSPERFESERQLDDVLDFDNLPINLAGDALLSPDRFVPH